MSTTSDPTSSAAAPAAAAQFEALLVTLKQLRDANSSQFAAIAVLAYDTILTFGDEVEYIWCSRWSIPKCLYIFARYYGLFHLSFLLSASTVIGASVSVCKFFFWYYAMGGIVLFTTVINAILVMRLYALYNRSNKVLVFIVLLAAAELGISSYVSVLTGKNTTTHVFQAPPGVPLTGCLTNATRIDHILESWITTLIVASCFFMLTFVNFLSLLRRRRGRWNIPRATDITSLTPLLAAFYRDGTLFFFLIVAVVLISTITTVAMEGPLAAVSLPWIITIYAISACRLILNLRAAAKKQNPNSTWAQTMTVQQF